jgi:hypothetical protein
MRLQVALYKYLIRRAARRHGLIDPVSFLSRLRSFSQPSEIKEPMTLVRAGLLFHARGMINARAIQFNLDWVWPYWVERQFDPSDPSFIPRGYAPTHVNLTQRNWTAVGIPGAPVYPLVDPRGLVTPFFDGWSLDFWLMAADGRCLLPSKLAEADQSVRFHRELTVRTRVALDDLSLDSRVWVELADQGPVLKIRLAGACGPQGRLAVSVRPYNPEGIQFVETLASTEDGRTLEVDGTGRVRFDRGPSMVYLSNYEKGDVQAMQPEMERERIACSIGMATGAAVFPADAQGRAQLEVAVPLDVDLRRHFPEVIVGFHSWEDALRDTANLEISDARVSFLYEAARRTLVLLSSAEIYPGPFTYRRFWFRDAVLMGNALLGLNLGGSLGRHLQRFPERQKHDGFFESQEGEWDANGQVLWLVDRWQRCTQGALEKRLERALRRGARWIARKRVRGGDPLREGLLPAGFSAEHLGPNDYYYWDDFWGIAGLRAAVRLAARQGAAEDAQRWAREAEDFQAAVFRSIAGLPAHRRTGAIPAAPYRRMDAGAVGSMVADYPLQLTAPGDARVMHTLAFLMENCFFRGGFFQDMIHSGINAYLTLALAQTLLRAGDPRWQELMESVAGLATATGQWPEAIHPFSGGGCMGDGQHGWAAAEWIMLVRNLFVREEGEGLVLGAGVLPQWLAGGDAAFGPTATPHGPVSLRLTSTDGRPTARVDARWHAAAPPMEIAVPGFAVVRDVTAGVPVSLEPRQRPPATAPTWGGKANGAK